MFVLYALYSSLYLPRHHVTPGVDQHSLAVPKSITPTPTPTPILNSHARTHTHTCYPPPQGSMCPRPLTRQCPQSIPALPSKEKQNQTEKRQNGPTLLSLSKLLTGPRRGPQRRVQLKMMTTEITSQVAVLQHSYTLALVCPFGYSEALRS